MQHGQRRRRHRRHGYQLDQLAEPDIVERDISLTRLDHTQSDNTMVQPQLVKDLLASSSDGRCTLTDENLAAFRLQRTQGQKSQNLTVQYGSRQHNVACLSISTILQILGDGKTVPCDYVRVFFLGSGCQLLRGGGGGSTGAGRVGLGHMQDPESDWSRGLNCQFSENQFLRIAGLKVQICAGGKRELEQRNVTVCGIRDQLLFTPLFVSGWLLAPALAWKP